MLSTSVWNLPSLWKGVERASIYMMMFLAVAMLAIPLVQPQEAEAGIVAEGARVLVAVAIAVVFSMCPAADCYALVGSAHSVTCYNDHRGRGWAKFYSCEEGKMWHHGSCEQN